MCEEKLGLARLPVKYRSANVPHRQCIVSMLANQFLKDLKCAGSVTLVLGKTCTMLSHGSSGTELHA